MQAVAYFALAVVGFAGVWYSGEPVAARASQHLQTFVVLYEPGPVWQPGVEPEKQPGIREHGRYLKQLFADGVMQSAGPLDGGGGLMVIRARDEAAARAVVASDPAVKSGLLVLAMLRQWEPRQWGASSGG